MPDSSPSPASPHFFLKIAEVKGDCRAPGHDSEIEIVTFAWGEVQNVAFLHGEKPETSVSMRDFVFTAATGSASSQLLLLCACGKRLKTAVLTAERPSTSKSIVFLIITLTDVSVASFEIEGSGERAVPMDRFSLKFRKIEFKYVDMNPKNTGGGNFESAWDMATNK